MSHPTSDLLRLLSILAVLIIHGTSAWEDQFHASHNFLSEGFASVVWSQIARFCVPVFVILSGYGLAVKYSKQGALPGGRMNLAGALEFYRARLVRIGIPFFVWTIVFLAFAGRFHWNADAGLAVNLTNPVLTVLRALAFEHADYHFYFFAVILECYLIFPLLIRFKSFALWAGLLVLQIVLTSPSHLAFEMLGLPVPRFPASFVVMWAFHFYTGMLFARRAEDCRRIVHRIPVSGWIALALFSFALVLADYLWWSYRTPGPGYHNHFHRQVVVAYALIVWALFVRSDSSIQGWLSKYPAWGSAVTLGAGISFAVFIFHTQILRLLNMTFFAWEMVLLNTALVAITFGLIYLVHRLVRVKWLRIVLGLPA